MKKTLAAAVLLLALCPFQARAQSCSQPPVCAAGQASSWNGTAWTCVNVCSPTRTCNAAGCYMKMCDGTTEEWFTGPYSSTMYNNTVNSLPLPLPLTQVLQAQITTLTSGTDTGEGALFTVTGISGSAIWFYNERNADHGGNPNAPMIYVVGY